MIASSKKRLMALNKKSCQEKLRDRMSISCLLNSYHRLRRSPCVTKSSPFVSPPDNASLASGQTFSSSAFARRAELLHHNQMMPRGNQKNWNAGLKEKLRPKTST